MTGVRHVGAEDFRRRALVESVEEVAVVGHRLADLGDQVRRPCRRPVGQGAPARVAIVSETGDRPMADLTDDLDDDADTVLDSPRGKPLRDKECPKPFLIPLKRSEEHTSELQSLMRISYAVFSLKKKKTIPTTQTATRI